MHVLNSLALVGLLVLWSGGGRSGTSARVGYA